MTRPPRPVRLLAVVAGWSGLLALQVTVAVAYANLGTWWHWLLHQLVGWGVGLGVAAVVEVLTGRRTPAALAMLAGQLVSIVPDLQFRYARMPHDPSMDVWLGHISLHTGPSPVLVAEGVLLLGGWAYVAVARRHHRLGVALALAAVTLLTAACLLAQPLPETLADYPLDTDPV